MSCSPALLYSNCVILEKPFHNCDLGRNFWDSGHCFIDDLVYDQIRLKARETVYLQLFPTPTLNRIREKSWNDRKAVLLWHTALFLIFIFKNPKKLAKYLFYMHSAPLSNFSSKSHLQKGIDSQLHSVWQICHTSKNQGQNLWWLKLMYLHQFENDYF